MAKTTVDINSEDESLTVTFSRSKEVKPKGYFHWRPIGIKQLPGGDEVGALKEISQFTKPELYLLEVVDKNLIEHSCQLTIVKSEFTKTEKRQLTKAIKLWLDKGLIKRIKREQYMVNPNFLIPPLKWQEPCYLAWKYLP